MKHFKTAKGTELPVLDLRGKDYLQVAHRLVWFREIHPAGTILTEFIQLGENHAIAKATIMDGNIILATAHKCEDRKGFGDFIEKAETGAIGRALAACGFGTQFAPELDEGERIVDSPTVRKPIPISTHHNAVLEPKNVGIKAIHTPVPGNITKAQQQLLWVKSQQHGWSEEDVRDYLGKIGLESTSSLNYVQFESLLQAMKNYPKEATR